MCHYYLRLKFHSGWPGDTGDKESDERCRKSRHLMLRLRYQGNGTQINRDE